MKFTRKQSVRGKPTEWEASDLPSGGGTAEWMKIATISVVSDDGVEKYIIDKDENGNTFSFNEIMIVGTHTDYGGKLNIWFNRQDMVFTDAVALSNFFDFRSRVAVQINRLHDDVFGVLSYGLGKPSDVAQLHQYFTAIKKNKNRVRCTFTPVRRKQGNYYSLREVIDHENPY